MKYETFDLEKALQGHPVVLRNGAKAYVRHYEKELDALFPLIGYIVNDRGKVEDVCSWIDNGPNVKGAYPNLEDGTDIVGMYPQYKLIHGVKVPTFRNWIPDIGDMVYVVRLELSIPLEVKEWRGTPRDMCALERGLVFPHTMLGHKAARLLAKTLVTVIQEG